MLFRSAAGLGGPYALVSLLIGVNDQYRGGDAEAYRTELHAVLARAVSLARGGPDHVLVLSIPDWGVTPFAARRDRAGISAGIDRFNDACREESRRAATRWVDVTAASREARSGWVAPDGLHPSALQYTRWAELALPEATRALGG